MKKILAILAAIAVVAGGYFWFSGKSADEAVTAVEVSEPAENAAETTAAEEAAAAEQAAAAEAEAAAAEKAAADAAAEAEAVAAEAEKAAAEAAAAEAAATAEGAVAAETATTGAEDLFTVEGFDMDEIGALIDGSELGALQKTTLKAALEQAKANPDLLKGVLDQVKTALNM